MRISQLRLAGQGHWPELQVDRIGPRLNAFYAPAGAGKSCLARLIGHLIYGKVTHTWSRYQERTDPVTEGSLRLESAQGQFMLRRRDDGSALGKLTIAAIDGTNVTDSTLGELLWNLSPQFLARLLAVDSREPTDTVWLLQEIYARREMFLPIGRSKHCPTCNGHGPASELLAQLSGGELVQIRQPRGGQPVMIIDREERALPLSSLTMAQNDQLGLAITLALYDMFSRQGIELPMVLDDPFRRQSHDASVAMARVLAEFANLGRQVLVFTANHSALDCWNAMGTITHDLEVLRREWPERKPIVWSQQHRPAPAVHVETPLQTTSVRVVREPHGRREGDLRLANVGVNDSNLADEDIFFLSASSSLSDFPVLGEATGALFEQLELYSVDNLLTADAEDVALRLDRSGITTETVSMWQTHMLLMCYIPGVSLDDAQVLSAVGVQTPDDLLAADADELSQSIEGYLSTDRGQRFAALQHRYHPRRLQAWQSSASRHRRNWERNRSSYGWLKPVRSVGSRNGIAGQRTSTRYSSSAPTSRWSSEMRFYLDLSDDVEKAPSIDPETAERLLNVGIRTVADLLNADPESTAEEMAISHIQDATIAAWQHQARLCCRIPQLRGYSAQLLVGCGYTEPEQITGSNASEVVQELLAFCETKEAQRILRNCDTPDHEQIEGWIALAELPRSLEVA